MWLCSLPFHWWMWLLLLLVQNRFRVWSAVVWPLTPVTNDSATKLFTFSLLSLPFLFSSHRLSFPFSFLYLLHFFPFLFLPHIFQLASSQSSPSPFYSLSLSAILLLAFIFSRKSAGSEGGGGRGDWHPLKALSGDGSVAGEAGRERKERMSEEVGVEIHAGTVIGHGGDDGTVEVK